MGPFKRNTVLFRFAQTTHYFFTTKQERLTWFLPYDLSYERAKDLKKDFSLWLMFLGSGGGVPRTRFLKLTTLTPLTWPHAVII